MNIFKCKELSISTADGKQHVQGYITLPIQVDNVLRLLKVLVVPTLCHDLILGIVFCNIFKLQINFGDNSYVTGNSTNGNLNVINAIQDRSTLNGEQDHILSSTTV